MKLSVIIVSYNVKDYVEQCLRSLEVAARGITYEVWVVDNASTDGSIDYLRNRFPAETHPEVHLIGNSRNVGFGRANNMAFKKAKGEYILFLNPDTVLTEDTLRDCLNLMEQQPQTGLVGVRMLKADGTFALESRRGLPSPFTAFCKMSGLAYLFPKSRLFGRYYLRFLDEYATNPIEIVSGAFMMAPHGVLTECGVFDEDFFMYGEDIDLSYRVMKAGYTNHYVPTPILHYKGESTEKSSYRYVHIFYEAMLIFFNKHYSHYSFCLSIPIRIAIYARAVLAIIKQQSDKLKNMLQEPMARQNSDTYLFVGPPDMIREARELASKWVLNATFHTVDDKDAYEGHKALTRQKNYTYVVYDFDFFGFRAILSYFKEGKGELIGLYSQQTGKLITSKYVYSR